MIIVTSPFFEKRDSLGFQKVLVKILQSRLFVWSRKGALSDHHESNAISSTWGKVPRTNRYLGVSFLGIDGNERLLDEDPESQNHP